MSNPVVFEVFCPQEVVSAGAPGAAVNRQVRLQTESLTKETDLSTTIFDSVRGGAALTFTNLSEDAKSAFLSGKKYRVSIEQID